MSDGEKKSGFKWLEKLKKVKHIEIYIAIIFVVIVLLIYLSNFNGKSKKTASASELSITAYVDKLESDLEGILSNIGGVTNVKVMITLDMSSAEVTNQEITLNQFPNIMGVIVTAKGVNNTATKLKVLQAVEAVLEISSGNIQILSSD